MAFLESFVSCSLRDLMHDDFYYLEYVSMYIIEYESHFHDLSRYLVSCIYTELERIHKFTKGLEGPYQLATNNIVVSGDLFRVLLCVLS